MKRLNRLATIAQAAYRLGIPAISRNLLYRFGLVSGHYRRITPPTSPTQNPSIKAVLQKAAGRPPRSILALPEPETLRWMLEKGVAQVLGDAREIIDGKFRLYGSDPVPLDLDPHTPPVHWTKAQKLVKTDIKDIWEPARFGWVFTLGRAYRLTQDENYTRAFWEGFETFQRLNPYNIGPNWASGQEVALRILALGFGWQVFFDSPESTQNRLMALACSIYEHAVRIPSTMIYARSQKNNHLISEAVGLLTAGWLLPEVEESPFWQKKGWRTLNQALHQQIDTDGTYMQQSINYHRLMLEDALWAYAIQKRMSEEANLAEITADLGYTKDTLLKLNAAAKWLAAQVDPVSGSCPNLGANDGAHILPLAGGSWYDYRPAAQAAVHAFSGDQALPAGPWDEQSLWLGISLPSGRKSIEWLSSEGVHRLGDAGNWAELRAVYFHDRPSHADQLHVDLWWAGLNLALDAGTYRYSAASPWNNSLSGTAAHNTVIVDGQDQMKRAGRFLWLDWAQAQIENSLKTDHGKISAHHNGYLKLGILHRRTLEKVSPFEWQVTDELLPAGQHSVEHTFCLHWLVPDLPYTVSEKNLAVRLETPAGLSEIHLSASCTANLCLIRCGETVCGSCDPLPIYGWHSPAYSRLEPALSILLTTRTTAPLELQTRWILTPYESH